MSLWKRIKFILTCGYYCRYINDEDPACQKCMMSENKAYGYCGLWKRKTWGDLSIKKNKK